MSLRTGGGASGKTLAASMLPNNATAHTTPSAKSKSPSPAREVGELANREGGPNGRRCSGKTLAASAILSIAAAAQGAPDFGTKADPIPSPSAAGPQTLGYMPMVQMLIALSIVFLLIKFVMPKFMNGLGKKLITKSGSGIEIEDTASFAGGQLYVVSVRGKSLLLSASQGRVSCLADLTDARPRSEQPLFMDMLQKETLDPSHLFVEASGEPTPVMRASMTEDEIQAAIERLNRLGG